MKHTDKDSKFKLKLVFHYGVCLFPLLLSLNAFATLRVEVAIPTKAKESYQLFIKNHGIPAEQIETVTPSKQSRSIACLIIIKKALLAGGLAIKYKFIESPSAARTHLLIKNGDAVISPSIVFRTDELNEVYLSSPLFQSQLLYKGLFGLKSNRKLMKVRDAKDLHSLTAVIDKSWKQDIALLNQLAPKSITQTYKYSTMINLVAFRGIDFTLLDFRENIEDSTFYKKARLHPVPGVAVTFKKPRHFMISKKHPHGSQVYQALEKGLKVLKANGTIEKLFEDAGVIRSDVNHLKILNEDL